MSRFASVQLTLVSCLLLVDIINAAEVEVSSAADVMYHGRGVTPCPDGTWPPCSGRYGFCHNTKSAALKHCWCKLACPPGQERYGDGSACRGGGKPTCDLGFCSGSPNKGMPPCQDDAWSILCPASCTTCKFVKPWCQLPCPAGMARVGDGSVCRGRGLSCDLGWIANSPNSNASVPCYEIPSQQCPDGSQPPCKGRYGFCPMKKGILGNMCWCKLACPPGQERYGDGSACRGGGKPTCDLGFCSRRPNTGMKPCQDASWKSLCPTTGCKNCAHGHPWCQLPCPAGMETRVGDGSLCKGGGKTCDLGWMVGSPNEQASSGPNKTWHASDGPCYASEFQLPSKCTLKPHHARESLQETSNSLLTFLEDAVPGEHGMIHMHIEN